MAFDDSSQDNFQSLGSSQLGGGGVSFFGVQPLDVMALPRIDKGQKNKIDQSPSSPAPENWEWNSMPFRWLECVPPSAWSAILQACRCHSIVDLSNFLAH